MITTDQEAIDIAKEKFKGLVYPYMGSGMLTNTENEDVINSNVNKCINVMLEYSQSKQSTIEDMKILLENASHYLETENKELSETINEYLKSI